MSRLTRDGTTEPVSRDQIVRHVRGQGNINFPCSADHEQDWQPYPVDPYSAIYSDHTTPVHSSKKSNFRSTLLLNPIHQTKGWPGLLKRGIDRFAAVTSSSVGLRVEYFQKGVPKWRFKWKRF